jgi:dihydropteroate synthase
MNWTRQRHQWRIRDAEIPLGARTLITGILDVNLFLRDTGKPGPDETLRAAQQMEEHGAALLDVTAQGDPIETAVISSDSELRRLVPVLRKLRHNLAIPICVTTCHADTAERALELGAAIIHDFSGLAFDPQLAPVVNRAGAGLVIGHTRGMPETWSKLGPASNLIEAVARDLDSSIARARAAGIDRRHIVIDPGFNMGKRGPENFQLLRNLEILAELGQPLQVSPSRKPFLVESVRAPDSERLFAAAAAAAISAAQGAHLLRVHEVHEIALVVKAVDRMLDSI